MAHASAELLKLCRFCLSEDEKYLISVEDVLDVELTIEDLVRFTGIQLNEQNKTGYYVCIECTNKLKISSNFRNTCLSNDPLFHNLRVLAYSVGETDDETIEHLADISDKNDILLTESHSMDPIYSAERSSGASSAVEILDSEDELFSYSANFITPAEKLYTEVKNPRYSTDWSTSLNPAFIPTRPAPHPRENGKRKVLMCEKCALFVRHIPSHMLVHEEARTFHCPHCPVKTKQKTGLSEHIRQVHLRKPSKKCNVCGQQFIHHKTYRYHMLTHEGKGKTFECPDCEKTFPNAIYLRDHFNRLHNAAKTVNKMEPQNVRRKRNRSQISAAECNNEG